MTESQQLLEKLGEAALECLTIPNDKLPTEFADGRSHRTSLAFVKSKPDLIDEEKQVQENYESQKKANLKYYQNVIGDSIKNLPPESSDDSKSPMEGPTIPYRANDRYQYYAMMAFANKFNIDLTEE